MDNLKKLLLALLLIFLPWQLSAGQDFTDFPAYSVVRIVDGDTVVLMIKGERTKVRLIGVDTPETVHPQKPVEYYGKEATTFLRNMLEGESVFLEYDQERNDRYGRLLAYLYRAPDGLFVNLEIVRQGYGHIYTRFPFKHMELFREYGRKASRSGRGLWGDQPNQLQSLEPGVPPGKIRGEVTVYLTRTGKKYHTGSCRYLRKSKISVSLEKAKERATPCKVCKPPR